MGSAAKHNAVPVATPMIQFAPMIRFILKEKMEFIDMILSFLINYEWILYSIKKIFSLTAAAKASPLIFFFLNLIARISINFGAPMTVKFDGGSTVAIKISGTSSLPHSKHLKWF